MSKTIRDWLMELEQPYRSQAIYNAFNRSRGHHELDEVVEHMHNAINWAFVWGDTVQGHEYWSELFSKYEEPFRLERERLEREREEQERAERDRQRQEIESRRVHYSTSMKEMLYKFDNENGCKVSGSLLSEHCFDNSFANYITMRGELCSYLPNGREHKVNPDTGRWLRDGRQDMKPAKLARKLMLEEAIRQRGISDADFEKFSNLVKSYISVVGDEDGLGRNIKLEVISGEAIKEAYWEENYSKIMGTGSNLWNSCMRYEGCQGYFGMYTLNPNQVQMLVALDSERKVLGRALLWNFTDNTKGMDTIYAHESLQECFISWAIENDYIYKASQSCHHHAFDKRNRENHIDCYKQVKLDVKSFKKYPYMDSMYYYSYDGTLSNDSGDYDITLRCTGGGYEEDREGQVLDINGEYIDDDDARYICYTRPNGRHIEGYVWYECCIYAQDGEYYLDDDCVQVDGDYYLENDEAICCTYEDEWELKENCVMLDAGEHEGEWAHSDEAVCLGNGEWVLMHEAEECVVDGDYYFKDDMEKMENGDWVANENKETYLENLKETADA